MAYNKILNDNDGNNIYANILGANINEDTEIYRIFSFQRFVETFINKQLTLVHPSKFEDPYENVFLSSGFNVQGHYTPVQFSGSDYLYIQCWSHWNESDALWRIYSHDKLGIKVKTTISKLLKYFYDKVNITSTLSTFIGEVDYWPQNQILNPNSTKGLFNIASSTQIIKTVLIKRTEFEHEKEVRLVFHVPGSQFYNSYQFVLVKHFCNTFPQF